MAAFDIQNKPCRSKHWECRLATLHFSLLFLLILPQGALAARINRPHQGAVVKEGPKALEQWSEARYEAFEASSSERIAEGTEDLQNQAVHSTRQGRLREKKTLGFSELGHRESGTPISAQAKFKEVTRAGSDFVSGSGHHDTVVSQSRESAEQTVGVSQTGNLRNQSKDAAESLLPEGVEERTSFESKGSLNESPAGKVEAELGIDWPSFTDLDWEGAASTRLAAEMTRKALLQEDSQKRMRSRKGN